MWYAFEGGVSTDNVEGSIPITENQYNTAINGIVNGKTVTIVGGFKLVVPPADGSELPSTLEEAVDAERDRRIDAGFIFEGVHYQSRPEDRENIAGAKAAASDAIILFGATEENYAWQQLLDPSAPDQFLWIAADNSTHLMDAQTVMRFGYAALTHKQAHILAARALKNMDPIPEDYATNSNYWP